MRQFSSERMLAILILVLFGFLVITASLATYEQREMLRANTLHDVQGDLDLMADASLEALLKSDYAAVRNFIKQWGGKRREYHELLIIAPNNFIIAHYRNPEPPDGDGFTLTKEVMMGRTKLATIFLHGDYCESDKIMERLRNGLILAAFAITTLLGAAVWFLFRSMAIEPLEDAVRKRTQALLDANHELAQLTDNSPT